MNPARTTRAAELVSGLGAIVLGAGLALVAPQWLREYGLLLLVLGAAVHGAGMSVKYRLETRSGPLLWWEQALFWVCWIGLVAVGTWVGTGLATR